VPPKFMPQSLLFPVGEWSKATATAWLRSRGYKTEKVVKEANHYRSRQFDPGNCVEGSFRTSTWLSRKDANMRGRRKPKKILAVFCRRRDE
jgi:hypothetical protein